MPQTHPQTWFDYLAAKASYWTGRSITFLVALGIVVVWAITGPIFKFSDTWQLVINTGTTIVTFLMVFLIQSTQNRDTGAMQVKLDELLRAVAGAENGLCDLEDMGEEDLRAAHDRYHELAEKARTEADRRQGRAAHTTKKPEKAARV